MTIDLFQIWGNSPNEQEGLFPPDQICAGRRKLLRINDLRRDEQEIAPRKLEGVRVKD